MAICSSLIGLFLLPEKLSEKENSHLGEKSVDVIGAVFKLYDGVRRKE